MILKVIAISLMMMSSVVNAYNILIVTPLPYKSHWIFVERIMERLLERGYSLTVISPFKFKYDGYEHESLKEIIIPKYKVEDIFSSKDVFSGKYESDISYIQAQYKIGLAVSEFTLSQKNVQQLIKSEEKKFNIVLVDDYHQDSLFMFAEKFQCPLITIDVEGISTYLDESMGVMTPHSFVPHRVTKYDSNMTYMQRCYNTLLYFYEATVRKFSYIPAQNNISKKYFQGGMNKQVPHIQDVINKISIIFSNNFRMSQDRPKMATQLNVAGLHLAEEKALPEELDKIISNAKHSIIYFSLGADLKPSEMPKEKLDEIIKAFGKIKKTILWKYDGDIPAGLPDNIIMKKWFPQNDLLAKDKVVLFITQGGTMSFQEGLSNHVPMLVIPFTGQQYRNGMLAERGQFGKLLQFDDITEETLTETINELLSQKTYFSNASKFSESLFNSPIEPVKEAVFWIHHLYKYQEFEKPPSVKFSWCTYHGLDVLAFYFGLLMTFILFWVLLISLIVRRYRQREQKGKFKYY